MLLTILIYLYYTYTMPTLPVYIRVDDLDKWKALPNKAEFIHNALNVREAYRDLEPKQRTAVKKVIKTAADAADAVKEVFPDAKPLTYKKTGNWGA